MQNILIVNGAKQFAHSKGELNNTLTDFAQTHLSQLGCNVRITRTDSEYDIQQEIDNYVWADVIIYQMPGWWMGAPWTMKKYIDDIFTIGHGSLYASDGRSRSDTSITRQRSITHPNSRSIQNWTILF